MNDEPQRPGRRTSGMSSRTRPTRRRPDPPVAPDLRRVRRNLGRAMLVLALLIAMLSVGSAALLRTRHAETPSTPPGPAATATAPPGAISVTVTHIVDGDTLDVMAAGTPLRVRLYGIDAPEVGTPCAAEATQRLTELAGASVSLLPDARLTDQYGRQLRYVYTADGQSIDEALVREGLAHAWLADGALRSTIVALEGAARTAHRGCLWAGT